MLILRTACLLAVLLPGAAFAQSNPSFTLENRSGGAIREFFATPAGRANWGQDRLNGRGLAAGGQTAFRLPADGNCVFDLKAVFADGRAEAAARAKHLPDQGVVAVGEAGASPATRAFRLFNHGTTPVAELAIRRPGAQEVGAPGRWPKARFPAWRRAPFHAAGRGGVRVATCG